MLLGPTAEVVPPAAAAHAADFEDFLSSPRAEKMKAREVRRARQLFLHDAEGLRARFQGAPEGHCGAPIAKKERAARGREKAQGCFAGQFLDPPECYGLDQKVETAHFVHWYTTNPESQHAVSAQDLDANGIPDYIDKAALYAEQSYEVQVNTLGWSPPPSTAKFPKLYTYYISTGAFGFTDFGFFEADTSGEVPLIAIRKNMSGMRQNDDPDGSELGALKVTIAHEFHHAIKAAYNWTVDERQGFWWDEATSVWVEDLVYPLTNDYLWYYCYDKGPDCSGWLGRPHFPLDYAAGLHRYGSSLFAKFLSENAADHPGQIRYFPDSRFDKEMIRQTWECIREENAALSLPCIARVIEGKGKSFAKVFTDFKQAVALKDFVDGWHPKFENVLTLDLPLDGSDPLEGEALGSCPLTGRKGLCHLASAYLVPKGQTISAALVEVVPALCQHDNLALGCPQTELRASALTADDQPMDIPLSAATSAAPQCGRATGAMKLISIHNASLTQNEANKQGIAVRVPFTGGQVSSAVGPPNGFTGRTNQSGDGFALQWNPVAGAASYGVFRSAEKGAFSFMAEAAGTVLNDTGVQAGTLYHYLVRPRDAQSGLGCPAVAGPFKLLDDQPSSAPFAFPNPAGSRQKVTIALDAGNTVPARRLAAGTALVDEIAIYTQRGRKVRAFHNQSCDYDTLGFIKCKDIDTVGLANGIYLYSFEYLAKIGEQLIPVRKVGKLVVLRSR